MGCNSVLGVIQITPIMNSKVGLKYSAIYKYFHVAMIMEVMEDALRWLEVLHALYMTFETATLRILLQVKMHMKYCFFRNQMMMMRFYR